MPGTASASKTKDSGRSAAPVVIGVVVVLLCIAAVAWVMSNRKAAEDKRAFLTPEAAKMRGPGQATTPAHEAFLQQLRSQERGGANVGAPTRRSN